MRKLYPVLKGNRRFAILLIFGLLVFGPTAYAQRTASVTGNWSSPTTWGGAAPPTAADAVIINTGVVVTLDAGTASCASITVNAAAVANGLTFSGSNTLTVTGAITMNMPTAVLNSTIAVGGGTLNCGSIAIAGSATANRIARITVDGGTINCSGNISFSGTAAQARLIFTSGTLNIQGNLGGGGTLTAGSSTINFNGTTAQTAGGTAAYVYSTMKVNNPAGVTLGFGASIPNLIIGDDVANSVFNDGGFTITMVAPRYLNLNSGTYNLGSATTGNAWPAWTTPTINTGTTVGFVSGVAQAVSASPPYQNVLITGAGTKTIATNATISGNLTVNGPASSGTAIVNVVGNVQGNGTITTTTGTWNVSGDWLFTGTLTSTGTVNFNGWPAQQINTGAASVTFNHVNISGGQDLTVNATTTTMTVNNLTLTSANNFTAPPTLNINGTLTLTAGYLTAGANINIAGTWTDNSGGFVPGTGTVTFTGAASNIRTTAGVNDQTFYNIVVNKTAALTVTLPSSLTVNNLTINTGGFTYSTTPTTLTVNGNVLISGSTFTTGAANAINVGGNWTNNSSATAFVSSTSLVTFQGGNQSIDGTFLTAFNAVTNNATLLSLGSGGMSMKSDFTNNGTFDGGTGTVTFIVPTSTTRYIYGNDPNFYNLTLTNAAASGILDATQLWTLTVENNLTLTTGTISLPAQTYVGGNWTKATAAVFNHNNGIVTFNGAGAQSIGGTGTPQNFYDIQVNNTGTLTNSVANLNIANILTIEAGAALAASGTTNINAGYGWTNNGGTFTPGTGTVTFNGGGGGYIAGSGSGTTQTFNNLVVNSAGNIDAYYGNVGLINVNGNFTLTAGSIYCPPTLTVTGNVVLTSGTLYGNTQINAAGNWTHATAATTDYTSLCGCNGVVNFNGGGAQSLAGTATTQTFNGFTLNKSGGTLTNSAVTTLNVNDNFAITSGTFSSALNSSVINITSNGSPNCLDLTGGTLTVTSTSSTVNIYGPASQGSGTFNSGGTVNYTDNVGWGQTVVAGTYNNLVLDDNNKTLQPGTISIGGVFTPGNGTGHVTTGNTVSFTGNTSQAIPTFNFVAPNSGNGYGNLTSTTTKILPANLAVNGVLSYAGGTGNITLGTMNIILGPTGSITGTPGPAHMVVINSTGRVIKHFPTGNNQSYTYPIGVGANYTPVTLTFNKVTTAGHVGVMPTATIEPNAIAPPTPATNWLKKYWVLERNGTNLAFDFYSANVTFLAADYNTALTAGAGGENTMGARVWDATSSTWITTPVVTGRTALSPTTSNITSLGNLTFSTCQPVAKTADPANQSVCSSGGSNSVTFNVGLSGTAASYQWYENGSPLSDGGNYAGSTGAKLVISNATAALDGNTYYVIVTGVCGGGFTSSTATVSSVSGTPTPVSAVTATPSTYRPGDNIVITATATNPASTQYNFIEAFPEGGGTFVSVQNTISKTYTKNNLSAYGTSIKSPGVTWLFVYANNACGQVTGHFYQISVIPPTTKVNPTSCGATDGSISFPGLRPSTQYNINYSFNGVAQPQISRNTNAGGTLTISNLSAGTYTNMTLIVIGVGSSSTSAPADPITLVSCPPVAYDVAYSNGISTAGATVSVCPGIANIGLVNAEAGVTYNLYEGASIVATNTPMVAGAFNFTYTPTDGNTYTVKGTAGVYTTDMTGGVILTTSACTGNTWLGTADTSWFNTANWSTGTIPNSCGADVVIPSGTPFSPVISGAAATLGNMEIESGATLTLRSQNLNVCGDWTGGLGSKAAIAGSGTVFFNSTTGAQIITGNTRFQSVQINNTNGVSLQGGAAVDVYTALNLQAGNFNASNGTVALKSTSVTDIAILNNFSFGAGGTYTGQVIAERYYAPSVGIGSFNQHFMGSPVNTPSLAQFGASGTPGYIIPKPDCDELQSASNTPYGTVFRYDQTHNTGCGMSQWEVLTSGSAVNAQGYSILKVGSGTLSLAGTPNLDNSYTVPALGDANWSAMTLQGRNIRSGWHLVSNPYSATLDPAVLGADNSASGNPDLNFDPIVYVWNNSGIYAGSYRPATSVAPFQAFMVHKTTANGTAPYVVNAGARTTAATTFFRKSTGPAIMITATNTGTGLVDETTVGFDKDATNSFDPQLDADKLPGSLSRHTLYTGTIARWMAINTLPSIEQYGHVPVGMQPGVSGNYVFNFGGLSSFDATSYITLEDKKLNVFHNVREGNYSFTANASDDWNRFVLHFTPAATIETIDANCAHNGMINISQQGTANWNYVLHDNNNVIIATGTLNAHRPVAASVAGGVYTLTLSDNNGYTVVKTIPVDGAGIKPAASLAVSATTTEVEKQITFTGNTTHAAAITWNFGDGATGTGANISHIYQNEGVYTVTLTATSATGCETTTTQTITVTAKNATGINDLANSPIAIWSNTNLVTVDFTNKAVQQATIDIYNLLGQQISSDRYTGKAQYRKEIANVEAGYVIVRVKNGDEITTRKLMITNTAR